MADLRQIVLDTETTGLEASVDRIVEIGGVELVNRRLTQYNYHQYINPEMTMPQGAFDVHGLSDEFLSDKPLFAEIFQGFIDYVKGSQLVIHNAAFDVAFINAEFNRVDPSLGKIEDYCEIIDSLAKARELHPGQRNNLDALAKRYNVDNSHRQLHGALLDSELLADVYLLMTGGQSALSLEDKAGTQNDTGDRQKNDYSAFILPVLNANEIELSAHDVLLSDIEKASGQAALWRQVSTDFSTHDNEFDQDRIINADNE